MRLGNLLGPLRRHLTVERHLRKAIQTRMTWWKWEAGHNAHMAWIGPRLQGFMDAFMGEALRVLTPTLWDAQTVGSVDDLTRNMVSTMPWSDLFKLGTQSPVEKAAVEVGLQDLADLQKVTSRTPRPKVGWWSSGNGRLLRSSPSEVILFGAGLEGEGRPDVWWASMSAATLSGWDVAATRSVDALYTYAAGERSPVGEFILHEGEPLRPNVWALTVPIADFADHAHPYGRGRFLVDGRRAEWWATPWDAWQERVQPLLQPYDPETAVHLGYSVPSVTWTLSTAFLGARWFREMFASVPAYNQSQYGAHWDSIGFTETTREQLRETLEEAVVAGEPHRQAAQRVQGVFQGVDPERATFPRALLIAQTELNAARNAGRHGQWADSGVVDGKKWSAALDRRTRAWHKEANGQVRRLNDPYTVGGVPMMYPGDWAGGAANTCNCRCTSIPKVLDLDADAPVAAPVVAAPEPLPPNTAWGHAVTSEKRLPSRPATVSGADAPEAEVVAYWKREVLPKEGTKRRTWFRRQHASYRHLTDEELDLIISPERLGHNSLPKNGRFFKTLEDELNDEVEGRAIQVYREYEEAVQAGKRGYAKARDYNEFTHLYSEWDRAHAMWQDAEMNLFDALQRQLRKVPGRDPWKALGDTQNLRALEAWIDEVETLVDEVEAYGANTMAKAMGRAGERIRFMEDPAVTMSKEQLRALSRENSRLFTEATDEFFTTLEARTEDEARELARDILDNYWSCDPTLRDTAEEGLTTVCRYSGDHVVDSLRRNPARVVPGKGRARYKDGLITLDPTDGARIMAHETGHHIEDLLCYANEESSPLGSAWIRARADDPVTLHRLQDTDPLGRNFKLWEEGYEGEWFDVYVGKEYNPASEYVTSDNAREAWSEVVSMYFDHLDSGLIGRLRNNRVSPTDSQHLNFVTGLLRGGHPIQ